MIKDIVVNLALARAQDPAVDYAISIARTFEAHITGVVFVYDPVISPTISPTLSHPAARANGGASWARNTATSGR